MIMVASNNYCNLLLPYYESSQNERQIALVEGFYSHHYFLVLAKITKIILIIEELLSKK
jgi:hypothetical protein